MLIYKIDFVKTPNDRCYKTNLKNNINKCLEYKNIDPSKYDIDIFEITSSVIDSDHMIVDHIDIVEID